MTGIANYFQGDTFAERRRNPTPGVAYDPESLLTGAEIAAGLTYADRRQWPDEATYRAAVEGRLTPEQVASAAPRIRTRPAVHVTSL